jgi:hypothetical protein
VIHIGSAIYAPQATRNIISFKDIRANDYHIHTNTVDNQELLHILTKTVDGIAIKESFNANRPGFYITDIHTFYADHKEPKITELWHRRLGHPCPQMFQKIIGNTKGIPTTVHPTKLKTGCLACSGGKLIIRPSQSKTEICIPEFLE